jgi:hypothetical protein
MDDSDSASQVVNMDIDVSDVPDPEEKLHYHFGHTDSWLPRRDSLPLYDGKKGTGGVAYPPEILGIKEAADRKRELRNWNLNTFPKHQAYVRRQATSRTAKTRRIKQESVYMILPYVFAPTLFFHSPPPSLLSS